MMPFMMLHYAVLPSADEIRYMLSAQVRGALASERAAYGAILAPLCQRRLLIFATPLMPPRCRHYAITPAIMLPRLLRFYAVTPRQLPPYFRCLWLRARHY